MQTQATVVTTNDVTLLAGSSFCRSGSNGDIDPNMPQGHFYRDTRVVSHWHLTLDDAPLESLTVMQAAPFAATFLGRAAPRHEAEEATVLLERRRLIADTLREDIRIRNFGSETLGATLALVIDTDFADLFDVKEGRPVRNASVERRSSGEELRFDMAFDDRHRGSRIRGYGASASRNRLTWHVVVPPQEDWQTTVEVLPSVNGEEAVSNFPLDLPVDLTPPAQELQQVRANTARFHCTEPMLQNALDRSVTDLVSLRMTDEREPGFTLVAAGAPWFMALFGRDSLITSWLAMAWDPQMARGTLHTLARLQASTVNALSEAEPGRILHEVRSGAREERALGASSVYYGSVDATPLFVMLLAKAARWGLPTDEVDVLIANADRALDWIHDYGDLDGDGFVEYQRKTDRGLLNQAWKDSRDSIVFRDGRLAQGPIATAEVQAYVYGAHLARAQLADDRHDTATARRCRDWAESFRRNFDEAFWMPEHGYYALALDGNKRQVDSLASNQGHCLWTGLAEAARADVVAERLLDETMFTGWGIRTLASSMGAYNPMSYHNGSVWPHDNAIIVEGLLRYGRQQEAERVAVSLIEAARSFGGRLPELFCGFARSETAVPVSYPTSCAPQAWAAATPIGLVSSLLDLGPGLTRGPREALPKGWGDIELTPGVDDL